MSTAAPPPPPPTGPGGPASGGPTPPKPAGGSGGSGGSGKSSKPAKPAKPAKGDNPLRGSRTSGFWVGVVAVTVLLILLIIFIAQNTERAPVTFLGWETEAPQAVLLLIATVTGMVVTIIAGSLRILQLRRRVKRDHS